jgi:ABC-type transport system involved in cytochrome c biogenesis permease component
VVTFPVTIPVLSAASLARQGCYLTSTATSSACPASTKGGQ